MDNLFQIKHYNFIAEAINGSLAGRTINDSGRQLVRDIIGGLSLQFANENPNFKAKKFLNVCIKDTKLEGY